MTNEVDTADPQSDVPVSVPGPRPAPPPKKDDVQHDPDRYIKMAKQAAVDNFNAHRDKRRSPELRMNGVFVVTFTKTMGNWKALVASPLIRGFLWDVTYNSYRDEIYIDCYKKVNSNKVELREKTTT